MKNHRRVKWKINKSSYTDGFSLYTKHIYISPYNVGAHIRCIIYRFLVFSAFFSFFEFTCLNFRIFFLFASRTVIFSLLLPWFPVIQLYFILWLLWLIKSIMIWDRILLMLHFFSLRSEKKRKTRTDHPNRVNGCISTVVIFNDIIPVQKNVFVFAPLVPYQPNKSIGNINFCRRKG